jgi:DNA-binding IclR family transcriptional regulator
MSQLLPRRTAPGSRPPHGRLPGKAQDWTFLTNHAHVLLSLSKEPALRMRDLADRVGITERAVQRIVADLVKGGYLKRFRSGRRNRYTIRDDLSLRHPVEQHCRISTLIRMILESS